MKNFTDKNLKIIINQKLKNINPFLDNSLLTNLAFILYKISRYSKYYYHTIFHKNKNGSAQPTFKKDIPLLPEKNHNYLNDEYVELSIIVPAYNVEKYIDQCISSISSQNLTFTYEIIIVEDCSTDDTKNILEKIKLKYDNLKIIYHQKNGGLSEARNTALNNIKGRFITFVDSDDLLCNNILNQAMNLIKKNSNIDVAGFKFHTFTTNDDIHNITNSPDKTQSSIITGLNNIYKVTDGYACGKIYHRKIFDNIRFPRGLCWEDGIILKIVMRRCTVYADLGIVGYLYRKNPNSITHSIKEKNLGYDHFYMINFCINEMKRLNLNIDTIFYKKIVEEATVFLNSRTFYLPDNDLLFMFEKLIPILTNDSTEKIILTSRQNLMIKAMKNKNISAWRAISF